MFVAIAGPPDPATADKIRGMASRLRGSTGEPQVWCDPAAGLAAASMSAGLLPEDVFDRQPWVEGDLCVVTGGRVDNREEAAGLLGLAPELQGGLSDSELLFRAYAAWGEGCMHRLTGDYSFCAIHRRTRRAFVATDHRGTSMVLYAQRGETLIVASQMGAMLGHPAVANDPDVTAVGLLVAPKLLDGRTAIAGVSLLLGGHCLAFAEGTLEFKPWWRPAEGKPIRYRDPRQYVEHALELFRAAATAQLRTTGGLSVMMSGGLDSTLVAGEAATQLRRTGRQLTAYTSVPEPGVQYIPHPTAEMDESAQAEAVVRAHPNMVHVLVRPEGRCPLDMVADRQRASFTLVRNAPNFIWIQSMMEQSRAAGARVMLHGTSGNGTVSLDERAVLAQLFGAHRFLTALRLARADQRHGGYAAWRLLLLELRFRLLGKRAKPPNERPGLIGLQPEFVRAHADLLEDFAGEFRSRDRRVRFATNGRKFWSEDFMARDGIEERDPLADKRLIEALLAFPVEAFMVGGRGRGLAREMGKGLVPDSVRLRRRRGTQSAEHVGLIALHAEKYRSALQSLAESPLCREVLNLKQGQAALDRIVSGKFGSGDPGMLDHMLDVGLFFQDRGL